MPDLVYVRRALVSVSDKTDLADFVKGLAEFSVQIISTGGTARALADAGIDVIPIEAVTGFPEMMDGRVKTLHPAIHGALLARRDVEAHVQAMREHDIVPIDLVCVNLYPFEQTIAKPDVSEEEAIEQIDIGGPSMLRSAAKNHASVVVVTSPDQYAEVLAELRANDGATRLGLRRRLAAAAFTRTAEYDTAISSYFDSTGEERFPAVLRLGYVRQRELRYGENPHQKAVLYADPASTEPSVVTASVLHGKPLSYNNINDAAGALELIQDLHQAFPSLAGAAIIKHTNPCGAAVADDLADAFDRAYAGDSLAAYGGILSVSHRLDPTTAQRICEGQKFFEVIIAPGYDEDAFGMLSQRWKNVRLLSLTTLAHSGRRQVSYRSVPGGLLAQDRDVKAADLLEWRHAAGPAPSEELLTDAAFIWSVVKHVTSNAVAIGRGKQLLGAGAGQMDRVASCRLAVEKAGERMKGDGPPPVAASDAFFPFPDGPQVLIDAGVKCIVHPGGSKRDEETFELCNRHDVTVMLTGVRHFRH
jgi:phosphoribosylaminoimidazolecarboxamide formyltransferase/IMP cyclohydrolase